MIFFKLHFRIAAENRLNMDRRDIHFISEKTINSFPRPPSSKDSNIHFKNSNLWPLNSDYTIKALLWETFSFGQSSLHGKQYLPNESQI